MTIGKREQIVIGVITAIALIAILHVAIFVPSTASFKKAKDDLDDTVAKISNLQTLRSKDALVKFNAQSDQFLKDLKQGIGDLKLDQPEEFVIPTLAEIKPDPAPAGKMANPEQAKKDKLDAIIKEKREKQKDKLLEEIERLRGFIQDRKVQMTFLGPYGWNIPTQLPPAMQSMQLWDLLKNIAEGKGTLERLGKNSPVYRSILFQYEKNLYALGLDVRQAQKLANYGEFVPLYYRLSIASLILKQNPKGHPILGEELTRDRLFKLLGIDLPMDPIKGIADSKVYFAFEELRTLNNLLDAAKQMGVSEVTNVVFRGYAFLRTQKSLDAPDDKIPIVDPSKLDNDETDDPSISGDLIAGGPMMGGGMMGPGMGGMMGPGMGMMGPGMGMMGPGMQGPATKKSGGSKKPGGGAPSGGGEDDSEDGGGAMPGTGSGGGADSKEDPTNKPKEDEIGYALPIKITFRASNLNAFSYIYEVLRDRPMTEIHRMVLKSMSQRDPNNPNIEVAATFLFVPQLFGTLDEVRKLIKELQEPESSAKSSAAKETAPASAATPTKKIFD